MYINAIYRAERVVIRLITTTMRFSLSLSIAILAVFASVQAKQPEGMVYNIEQSSGISVNIHIHVP